MLRQCPIFVRANFYVPNTIVYKALFRDSDKISPKSQTNVIENKLTRLSLTFRTRIKCNFMSILQYHFVGVLNRTLVYTDKIRVHSNSKPSSY